MPWPYAQQAGIVKKWADKYHVKIKLVQINDYVESLNQYTAGKLDGVTSTNMDALTIPAAGGRDSTVVMVGDYSNGNDGVVLKGSAAWPTSRAARSTWSQNSVSQYLLSRGPGERRPEARRRQCGEHLRRRYRRRLRARRPPRPWSPGTRSCWRSRSSRARTRCSNSSKIPGEIEDTLVMSTDALKANPEPRQGADRHLVRDHGRHDARRRPGQAGARSHGQAVGNQPRRLRGPAEDDLPLRHDPRPRSTS